MNAQPLSTPAARFRQFARAVSALLVERMRGAGEPLALFLVWEFLDRLARRVEILSARLAAGEIVFPVPRDPPDNVDAPDAPDPADWPREKLPCRKGWLVQEFSDFGRFGDQLVQILLEPEMQALLANAPQLKPSFRRLARMLGVECPPVTATVRSPIGSPGWPTLDELRALTGPDPADDPPRAKPAYPESWYTDRRWNGWTIAELLEWVHGEIARTA